MNLAEYRAELSLNQGFQEGLSRALSWFAKSAAIVASDMPQEHPAVKVQNETSQLNSGLTTPQDPPRLASKSPPKLADPPKTQNKSPYDSSK